MADDATSPYAHDSASTRVIQRATTGVSQPPLPYLALFAHVTRTLPGQLALLPDFESPSRIRGTVVPALFPPASGAVHTLIAGEAPGPIGADKSGVPFTGDAAGLLLFRALVATECATFPDGFALDALEWNGEALARTQCLPTIRGVAITNAFASCPTDNGQTFRAPKRNDTELRSPANLARLAAEVAEARARGLRQVIALGKVAGWMFSEILALPADGIPVIVLPHPSAQGLLQMAPDRGKGAKMPALRALWVDGLIAHLRRGQAPTAR